MYKYFASNLETASLLSSLAVLQCERNQKRPLLHLLQPFDAISVGRLGILPTYIFRMVCNQ